MLRGYTGISKNVFQDFLDRIIGRRAVIQGKFQENGWHKLDYGQHPAAPMRAILRM